MPDLIKHLPWPIQRALIRARERRADRSSGAKSAADVFADVYRQGRWGAPQGTDFYSGWGSHDETVVRTYVDAVGTFLRSLPAKPNVVDLGCGDFNVGKQLRAACDNYVACDVVPALIERNRLAFADLDVDFRCLDAISEPLPEGNVIFIRQVFQHLSNGQIQKILPKLSHFDHVVVTEHLPDARNFVPNLEKGPGDEVRAGRVDPSGVVLSAAPFNFATGHSSVLCEVRCRGGIIQTTLYRR